MNSTRLRPIAAGVAAAIGTMTFHPAVAQVTGQPTSPGEPCQTAPLENDKWTQQEQWVWSKVCEGEIADFNKEEGYGDELDPNEPQGWPESRVLTPQFLETILLHEPFRSAQTRLGVRIRGAWFKSEIDLEGGEIERKLWLERSRLDKGGSLDDARTGVLSLIGSVVGGPLSMVRAETGALYMSGAKFQAVNLFGAKIGGELSMSGSTFAGTLDMDSATVEGALLLRGAKFQKVDLRSVKIAGQVSMIGSTFAGTLTMNSATVEGDLLMREKAKFQEVDLIAAKIGGQLDMSGSRFHETLNMDSATVEGHLFMRGEANFQEVNLIAAKIGRTIDMKGSTFAETLNMKGATVVEDLLMQGGAKFQKVILRGAKIGGRIDMSGSTFDWTLSMAHAETGALFMSGATFKEVDLHGAKIVDQLDMTGSTFAWTLDMRSVTVGGDLLLRGADLTEAPLWGEWLSVGGNLDLRAKKVNTIHLRGATVVDELRLAESVWEPGSILDLQYAKVGRLVARVGQPCPASTMLAGFIYDALGSTTSQTPERNPVKDAADFVERWLGDEVVHSPQAHEQFAAVLRQMGLPDRARLTLYQGKNHELLEELRGWHLPQAGWLFALWAMIGYGYRVWYGLVWIAVLVAVGWRIARKSGRKLPGSGEPLGFWYSVDRLLPIMVLRKSHYDVDLPPRSRVYFYFHMVMGYVLSMFLLAGLSGLVG